MKALKDNDGLFDRINHGQFAYLQNLHEDILPNFEYDARHLIFMEFYEKLYSIWQRMDEVREGVLDEL